MGKPKKTAADRLKEMEAKHAERTKRLKIQAEIEKNRAELAKMKKK